MNQTGVKINDPAIKKRKKGHRARFHDYCAPGYYLITATCEEGDYSRKLLSRMPEVSVERLRDEEMIIPIFTPLGENVKSEIESISTYHPKVAVTRYVIMPDHIHLVIFVKERLDKPLGSELAGFLGACTRHYRNMYDIEDPSISLYEPFHDQIIFNYEQLRRSIRYVEDNPRRLIIKRMYPHLFKRFLHVRIEDRGRGSRHSGYIEFHALNDMAATVASLPAGCRMSILAT